VKDVRKDDARMEALGALDEANAALGVVRSLTQGDARDVLLQIQRHLYAIMAEVSATPDNAARVRAVGAQQVEWLESLTSELEKRVQLPREFIVPGDSVPGAFVDVARTVVRRAERRLVRLRNTGLLENTELLRYINRLSSYLFVLELAQNNEAGSGLITLARQGSNK
jgi:cob(I)alamin adenosyltransferase